MSKFRLEIISDEEGFAVLLSEQYIDDKGDCKTGLFKDELYRSTSVILCTNKFRQIVKRINTNVFKCTRLSAVLGNTYCIYEPIKERI